MPAIELELSPDDAVSLVRLPALSARREGRTKTGALKIVWYDTADGALAAQGLSLSEHRAQWRLERLMPDGGQDWRPATPAPLLACAPTRAALQDFAPAGSLPEALAPVAAFTGRQRDIALTCGGAPARLTILEGTLRGVLQDRKVCRIILSGEARAMAGLAAELSGHVPVRAPLASLAAQAFAVARGAAPAPRRLGAPSVPPEASLSKAISLITAHLADVILYWGSTIEAAGNPEPVHQMRVAVRRLRSALSVFRRALPDDRVWLDDLAAELKALAGLLGVARDWDVFLAETGHDVRAAFANDRRIGSMMEAAAKKRLAAYAALRRFLGADPAWRRLGLALALLPSLRPWEGAGETEQAELLGRPAAEYARGALNRRLKHVLEPGDSLDGLTHEHLHEIRKRAKRLRYAIEFFAPLFAEKAVRRYLTKLATLQEDFGALNDTAVAGTLVSSLGGGADRAFAAGAVQGYGAARVTRSAKKLQRGWAKFYRETPFWD
jgi:CHAD domain-containing protein